MRCQVYKLSLVLTLGQYVHILNGTSCLEFWMLLSLADSIDLTSAAHLRQRVGLGVHAPAFAVAPRCTLTKATLLLSEPPVPFKAYSTRYPRATTIMLACSQFRCHQCISIHSTRLNNVEMARRVLGMARGWKRLYCALVPYFPTVGSEAADLHLLLIDEQALSLADKVVVTGCRPEVCPTRPRLQVSLVCDQVLGRRVLYVSLS